MHIHVVDDGEGDAGDRGDGAPLALAQGMKGGSSSVVPDLLKRSKMLLLEGVEGGEKVGADAQGMRVWDILCATKPDLPTSEKKTMV